MSLQGVEELVLDLENIGAIKFGEFKLKSGLLSPVYFDLRVIVSYPKILDAVAHIMLDQIKEVKSNESLLCGVPYTALPIASIMSVRGNIGMVVRRKEAKDYGTKKMVEGTWSSGQDCIIVEDVITSGGSVKETAKLLREHDMKVTTCVVLLDREQGGKQNLINDGINVISIFPISKVLDTLMKHKRINSGTVDAVQAFINNNQTTNPSNEVVKCETGPEIMSFQSRSEINLNPVTRRLLDVMLRKQSNLCVAIDKTESSEVLELVEKVGKSAAVIKLHSDIIEDWSPSVQEKLTSLSKELDFMLFEDRKLADIGNTVKHQTSSICSWADLLTVHGLPGHGLIQGVQAACAAAGRQIGVLLVAEMSNAGNLFNKDYTNAVVSLGEEKGMEELVVGFIAQSRVSQRAGMLQMTPGVHLADSSDSGDQRYTSPDQAVLEKGADLVIAGRGICAYTDPEIKAEEYRQKAWDAYLQRIK